MSHTKIIRGIKCSCHLSLVFCLSLLSVVLLISCDNISEDERLIYEAPPVVNRHVLIEDFTGQRCVNCPNAADEIHKLQEEYGEDAIIAVGIHGGPMAVYPNPARNLVGLATETGDNYNNYWKVEQWPMGMVNRGSVSTYTSWSALVRDELQKTASINMYASSSQGIENDGFQISVTLEGAQGHTNGKLQVWITEDDITAIQLMPDGSANANYIHQHVFRTAVNGEWGEDISIDEGQIVDKKYPITLSSDWNIDNLNAVIFVYNDQGVQQVISIPLKENV